MSIQNIKPVSRRRSVMGFSSVAVGQASFVLAFTFNTDNKHIRSRIECFALKQFKAHFSGEESGEVTFRDDHGNWLTKATTTLYFRLPIHKNNVNTYLNRVHESALKQELPLQLYYNVDDDGKHLGHASWQSIGSGTEKRTNRLRELFRETEKAHKTLNDNFRIYGNNVNPFADETFIGLMSEFWQDTYGTGLPVDWNDSLTIEETEKRFNEWNIVRLKHERHIDKHLARIVSMMELYESSPYANHVQAHYDTLYGYWMDCKSRLRGVYPVAENRDGILKPSTDKMKNDEITIGQDVPHSTGKGKQTSRDRLIKPIADMKERLKQEQAKARKV